MKNNNVFKYIFIVFIIALIIGTAYVLYNQNVQSNEIEEENYLRINNTNMSAKTVAKIIKEKFEL